LYGRLDERALQTGAGAYSLVAASLSSWFEDQRRWLDALFTAWRTDPELADVNHRELNRIDARWRPQAEEALAAIAGAITELTGGETA
jgi:phenol hydroxylase P1 protein